MYDSVMRTNRCVIVDEAMPFASVGSHVAWLVSHNCFDDLDAAVELVSGEDVPMPYNHGLELAAQPSVEKIVGRREAGPLCLRKILMIALSPTMETGTLARWRKKEGDTVASGDVLCEVETDKATMDYESTAEGTLLKILLPEGGQAKVGDPIAIVGKPGEDISAILAERRRGHLKRRLRRQPAAAATAAAALHAPRRRGVPPSPRTGQDQVLPACPKDCAEKGHRPSRGARLGARGQDREAATWTGWPRAAARSRGRRGRAAPPGPAARAGDEVIPVSRMRKIIAQRLSESMYTAPHYYLTVAVGMDELLAARAPHERGTREEALGERLPHGHRGQSPCAAPAGELLVERGHAPPALLGGHRARGGAARTA